MLGDGQDWNGYFSKQYACKYDRNDIVRAKRFIRGQFAIVNKISPVHVDDRVLEIGCALGSFVEILKDCDVHSITGAELDREAAEFTRRSHGVPVIEASIEEMDASERYTKIYAFEVLEHLTNPISDLRKIYELLSPGGVFIGSTPFPFKRSITSDSSHMFVLHPLNWERLFKKAGFEIVCMRPATGVPFLYRFSGLFSIYFRFYLPWLPLVSTTLFVVRKPYGAVQ